MELVILLFGTMSVSRGVATSVMRWACGSYKRTKMHPMMHTEYSVATLRHEAPSKFNISLVFNLDTNYKIELQTSSCNCFKFCVNYMSLHSIPCYVMYCKHCTVYFLYLSTSSCNKRSLLDLVKSALFVIFPQAVHK